MIIFVRLLNESTVVYRPVDARRISEKIFEIIDHAQEQDETWEFGHRDRVYCIEHAFQDGSKGLIATSRAESAA